MAAAQATQQVKSLQKEIRATRGAVEMVDQKLSAFGRNLQRGAGFLRSFHANLQPNAVRAWGSQLQWAGRQMTYNFSLPLAAAGGAALKWASDTEAGFVRIQKVYGDTSEESAKLAEVELPQLRKAFEALSNVYGVHQSEVMAIAGDWAAAGAAGLGLAKATRLTMDAMILGEMEAVEATEALIAIQAQFGFSTEQLSETLDTLNMVENETGAQMDDLIIAFSRAAGTARSAGVDVLHLSAMVAALVPASGSASTAGNALKTMISRLLAPTAEAAEIMGLMGFNTQDLGWQSLNAAERLELMAAKFDTISDAQKAVVSATIASRYQINRFDVLMRDIINPVGYYQKALEAAGDETKNFEQKSKEIKTLLDSWPQELKQSWTIIQNSLMGVMQQVAPYVVYFAMKLAEVLMWFRNLEPVTQKWVLTLLAIVALVGPIAQFIGALSVLGSTLAAAFGTAMIAAGRTYAAFRTLLMLPFTAISTGVGAVLGGMSKVATAAVAAITPSKDALVKLLIMDMPTAAEAGSIRTSAALAKVPGAVVAAVAAASSGMKTAAGSAILASKGIGPAYGLAVADVQLRAKAMSVAIASGTRDGVIKSAGFIKGLPATVAVASEEAKWKWLEFTGITLPNALRTGLQKATTFAYTGGAQITAALHGAVLPNAALMARAGATAGAAYGNASAVATAATAPQADVAGTVLGTTTGKGFLSSLINPLKGIGPLFTRAFVSARASVFAFGAGVKGSATFILAAFGYVFKQLPFIIIRALTPMPGKVLGVFAKMGAGLFTLLRTWGPKLLGFITGPWGIALTIITSLVAFFWEDIKSFFAQFGEGWARNASSVAESFKPLVSFFNNIVTEVQKAFNRLPQGVQNAFKAVVDIVNKAAMKVYELFGYLNPFKRHSPSLVESVTWGMAEVKKQYASVGNVGGIFMKAAGDLKAFKQVANSMNFDEWADQRNDVAETMPQNLKNFNVLVDDLKVLNNLMVAQKNEVVAQQVVVDKWKRSLDAANVALDAQEAILQTIEDRLNGLKAQYEGHAQAAQDFAGSSITGMKYYTDALFENELAQKRLRLEMLNMGDGAQGIEDIRDAAARLQGDIESLRGESNDLRSAGAGSDVLGPINAQIAQMEAAYAAMSGAGSPVTDMESELARLQREAERLELEEALKFDPLKKQIDELVNGTRELTFEEIINGITNEQAAMAALQPSIDAATVAYAEQKAIVDELKIARDAVKATYDAESAALDILQADLDVTEDAIRDIEQALNDVSGAARNAASAMKAAKDAKSSQSNAADNYLAAAGADFADVGGTSGIGREDGDIEAWTAALNDELAAKFGDIFGSLDMFGPLREKWDAFTAWWRATVQPAWDGLVGGLKDTFAGMDLSGFGESITGAWSGVTDFFTGIWDKINYNNWIGQLVDLFGPQIENIWENIKSAWEPAWESIKTAFAPLWDSILKLWDSIKIAFESLKPILMVAGVAIGAIVAVVVGIFSGLLRAIGNVVGPIIEWVSKMIGSIIQIFTSVITFFSGFFSFMGGIINTIVGFFKGIFTGDWTGLQKGLKQMWDGLVQMWSGISNFFGAIWSAIWATIEGFIAIVWGAISGFVQGIVDWFTWLWDVLVGHSIIPDMVTAIIDWFQSLWDTVYDFVKGLVEDVVAFFQGLWDKAVAIFDGMMLNIKRIWDGLGSALQAGWDWIQKNVFDKIKEGAQWVADKFVEAKDRIGNSWDKMKEALGVVWQWIKDSVFERMKEAVAWVADRFESVKDRIKTAWDLVKTAVGGVWDWLRDNVFNKMKEGVEAIGSTFETVKDTITTAWNKIKGAAAAPVNFIIDKVYTGGIKSVWDKISGAVGLNLSLPTVSPIAYANGTEDHRAQIARGGAMRLWAEPETGGEAYIPLAKSKRGRSTAILAKVANKFGMSLSQYSDGGFWNSLGGKISGAANWIKDKALNVANFLKDPVTGIKDMISTPVEALMKGLGGGDLGKSLVELPRKSIEALIDKAKDLIGGLGGGGASAGQYTGALEGWRRPSAGPITSRFGPRNLLGGTFHNGVDIAGGGRTYAANSGVVNRVGWNVGYGNSGIGILVGHGGGLESYYGHNPVGGVAVKAGQLVAAGQHIGMQGATGNVTGVHLHYSIFRNGSAINPMGYGLGGGATGGGGGGAMKLYDNGGILPPGISTILNKTGGPEAVLSGEQWRSVSAMIERLTRMDKVDSVRAVTNNYNINFYGDLSFPGISDGDDAEKFISNLVDLTGA